MTRKNSAHDDYRHDERPTFERIRPPQRRGASEPPPASEPADDDEQASVAALEPFRQQKWITDVLHVVKSGKEATVYCCLAHPDTGLDLLAAKVYRARENRSFKNDAVYQEGRVTLDSRLRRAIANKTATGREAQFAAWVEHEYATLRTLYAAGAQVPVPFATAGSAILMQYLGDLHDPAPHLQRVTLDAAEVRPLFNLVLHNIKLWLACGRVHGDLSAFNMLYWRGKLTIIDFPQSVDPEVNRNAFALLSRDLANVCRYWARYGLQANPDRIAGELWAEYLTAGLG